MKVKTTELNKAALDWAVTLIEKPEACEYGVDDWIGQRRHTVKDSEYVYRWHQSWMQAGPIIEREEIDIQCCQLKNGAKVWRTFHADGPTPLIAAMRCFVASKLGDEVDVPEELL